MRRVGLMVAGAGLAAAITGCSGSRRGSATSRPTRSWPARGPTWATSRPSRSRAASPRTGRRPTSTLQVGTDGNCTGSLGVDDGTAEIIGVDGTTWLKPNEAFWRTSAGDSADQIISLVGDKWVVLPADEGSFDEFCNVDQLIDNLLKEDGDGATYTKSGTRRGRRERRRHDRQHGPGRRQLDRLRARRRPALPRQDREDRRLRHRRHHLLRASTTSSTSRPRPTRTSST